MKKYITYLVLSALSLASLPLNAVASYVDKSGDLPGMKDNGDVAVGVIVGLVAVAGISYGVYYFMTKDTEEDIALANPVKEFTINGESKYIFSLNYSGDFSGQSIVDEKSQMEVMLESSMKTPLRISLSKDF